MDHSFSENIEQIIKLCKIHHVKTLHAFGSIVNDRFNDNSDIDLLVSFEPLEFGEYADNYFNLIENFETLLKKPVDLVTDKSLSNPYFIDSINKSKVLIYEQ